MRPFGGSAQIKAYTQSREYHTNETIDIHIKNKSIYEMRVNNIYKN